MNTPIESREKLPLKSPDRQARLNAWLALHQIKKRGLADRLGTTPALISDIIAGRKAPAKYLDRLAEMGVPLDLLPPPDIGRPGRPRKDASKPTGAAA
jgi:hypothetical protein